MTELATVDPGTPQLQQATGALVAWAQEARQATSVAVSLARTSFVPASLRDRNDEITAANITAAILTGNELGLQPMAALRSMDIIQGTPALRAHAMRGLVQSRGHQVELVESTPELCRMRGRRAGADSWQQVTWTIGRAQQLGLTGKTQWKSQPQTMLVARATGEICRLIAADVLFAVPYAAEELHDHQRAEADRPAASRPVTAAEIMGTAPVRPVEPQPAADPAPAPPDDEPTAATARPVDHARPVSRPQVTKLHAVFGDLKLSGDDRRADRLAVLSALIDRPVGSSNDLSLDEARVCIDFLEPVAESKPEDQETTLGGLIVEGQKLRAAAGR
jgi:hypothetical protein